MACLLFIKPIAESDNIKRNFKQWWSTILPISTKHTITSHLKWLNKKEHMIYDFENTVPGFVQAQKCHNSAKISVFEKGIENKIKQSSLY